MVLGLGSLDKTPHVHKFSRIGFNVLVELTGYSQDSLDWLSGWKKRVLIGCTIVDAVATAVAAC